MALSICCAAEIEGRVRNLELVFDEKPCDTPTMTEQVEMVFRKQFLGPEQMMNFRIDFTVYFDEASRKWLPLQSVDQLAEWTQVFTFQMNGGPCSLAEIPQPSARVRVPAAPPRRRRDANGAGASAVNPDKLDALFRELDMNRNNSLSLMEVKFAFLVSGIQFKEEAIEKLFFKCDIDHNGIWTFEEFRIFGDLFPNTTEVLYWRLLHGFESQPREVVETTSELRALRQKESDLQAELMEIQQAAQVLQSRVASQRSIARSSDPQKTFLEAEEQDLMNKEFALQFHRDMVVQAESLFSETAKRFNHSSIVHGSSRRSMLLQ